MTEFICNVCGRSNQSSGALDRESSNCSSCGSNVRARSLMYTLSMELFGVALTLPDFPRVKSLHGMGTSDLNEYATRLAQKLDYRNTFYEREPRFDIAHPARDEFGQYDFLISSDVFEHVTPPVESALRSACELLKPNGVMVLSVPYSVESSMSEHFPDLHEFGFAQIGGKTVLVNRTQAGQMQVFENPVFHASRSGPALEMREFNEEALKGMLRTAGFGSVRIYGDDYAPFGIAHAEAWSLPMAARKGEFALSIDATRDVVEEWRDLRQKFDGEMQRMGRSYWFRLGRKLGLL